MCFHQGSSCFVSTRALVEGAGVFCGRTLQQYKRQIVCAIANRKYLASFVSGILMRLDDTVCPLSWFRMFALAEFFRKLKFAVGVLVPTQLVVGLAEQVM
jgi:hypothetical protein